MSETCKHFNFAAKVIVARLEDTGKFMADVTVKCADCDKPFLFVGLEPGLNMRGPTVSIDGTEARFPIAPEGVEPSPFQRMVHGVEALS